MPYSNIINYSPNKYSFNPHPYTVSPIIQLTTLSNHNVYVLQTEIPTNEFLSTPIGRDCIPWISHEPNSIILPVTILWHTFPYEHTITYDELSSINDTSLIITLNSPTAILDLSETILQIHTIKYIKHPLQ